MANRPGWLAPVALLILGLAAAPPLGAATTERIVTDRFTGLAIGGFDPVAYFAEQRPVPGRPSYEVRQDGVVWRFENEGNMAAFTGNPDVYQPRYGGYDPVAVARGVAVAGNPLVWLIAGDRVYLFYSFEAQATFAASPNAVIAAADQRWPEVLRALAP